MGRRGLAGAMLRAVGFEKDGIGPGHPSGQAGLSALGRPLAEVCFRLDAACALLGVPPEASLTPERLAKLLASGAGGRKNVGTRVFYVILNQADDAPRHAAGERTLTILKETYNVSGFLTHFEEGERA